MKLIFLLMRKVPLRMVIKKKQVCFVTSTMLKTAIGAEGLLLLEEQELNIENSLTSRAGT
jgi:hypothetical protein